MMWNAFLIPILILFGVLSFAANLIWLERRLLALWQDRYGPNRVGPFGILQTVADAIKMFFKEDWIPPFSDKSLFVLAPTIIMMTSLMGFSVVPFADGTVILDSSVGLLIFLGISSLGSYSIVIAGWSSNNKYALLGALRGACQMISYEVFMALSLMGVVMVTGSLRLTDIVNAQKTMWNLFPQCIGLIVFYIAALAETHRLPFDIPEAESELVAGFHSEYSGLKFGMFFVGEYIGIALMSSMMVVLFFGGWNGPFFPPILWFVFKTFLLVCTFILVRGSLPRPRYDQLMSYGWKMLLPLSLLNLLATGAYLVYFESNG